MTKNLVKKICPVCNHPEADVQGASIVVENYEQVSYNKYKCVAKNHIFYVKRKGDTKEQQLTEKFIKSKPIILKKYPKKTEKPREVHLIDKHFLSSTISKIKKILKK